MKRLKSYSLEPKPSEDYNRPRLTYRDKRGMHSVEVNTGKMHELRVYREGEKTYVLTFNSLYGCAGLQVFHGNEELGEVFLQNRKGLESVLGKKALEVTLLSMVRRMANVYEAHYRSSSLADSRERCTFELQQEHLTPAARKQYLELMKGKAPRGPLAIFESPEGVAR